MRKWTEDEKDLLSRLKVSQHTVPQIAEQLGRTERSVAQKWSSRPVKDAAEHNHSTEWTKIEDDLLTDLVVRYDYTIRMAAKEMQRTPSATAARWDLLRREMNGK